MEPSAQCGGVPPAGRPRRKARDNASHLDGIPSGVAVPQGFDVGDVVRRNSRVRLGEGDHLRLAARTLGAVKLPLSEPSLFMRHP